MSDQEIPEWAFTRVVRLANPTWDSNTVRNHPITVAFARYIAQHEQSQADRAETLYREMCFVAGTRLGKEFSLYTRDRRALDLLRIALESKEQSE